MKKILSLIMVAVMLFTTVSVCAVPAGAISTTTVQSVEVKGDFSLAFARAFRSMLNTIIKNIGFGSIKLMVTGVELSESKITLEAGKSETVTATVKPEKARNKNVEFQVDDIAVASVNSTGVITARRAGETYVYAITEDGGFYDKVKVVVTPKEDTPPVDETIPCTNISLSSTNVALKTGETEVVSFGLVPSDTTDKVKVSVEGNSATAKISDGQITITSVSEGTSTVHLECGNVVKKITVYVSAATIACTDITLENTNVALKTGETANVKYNVTPSDTTDNIVVSVKGDSVTANASDGIITINSVTEGESTVYIQCGNIVKQIIVTVEAPVDNSSWSYENGVLTIINDNAWDIKEWSTYVSENNIKTLVIGDSVTYIPEYAFADTPLEYITIGKSVASLGEYAFVECYSLKEVNFNALECRVEDSNVFGLYENEDIWEDATPDSFEDKLEQLHRQGTLNIGKGVNLEYVNFNRTWFTELNIIEGAIYNHNFHMMFCLEKLTIGEKVGGIEENSFVECCSLKEVNFNALECRMEEDVFGLYVNEDDWDNFDPNTAKDNLESFYRQGTLNIGKGVNLEYVDFGRTWFTELNITDGYIYDHNFNMMVCLEKLTIGEKVEYIEEGSFEECYSLQEVNFNALECRMEENVFHLYANEDDWENFDPNTAKDDLELFHRQGTLNIGKGVNLVYVGFGRTWFTELNITDGYIYDHNFSMMLCLEKLTIGEKVEYIEERAFEECYSLQEVNFNALECRMEENVFHLYVNDFSRADYDSNEDFAKAHYSIGTLNIGPGVSLANNNYDGAYFGGSTFSKINISEDVDGIGNYMFEFCYCLEEVTFDNDVKYIGDCAFGYCFLLSKATYIGTNEDWEFVEVGEENEYLLNALGFDPDAHDITYHGGKGNLFASQSTLRSLGCTAIKTVKVPTGKNGYSNQYYCSGCVDECNSECLNTHTENIGTEYHSSFIATYIDGELTSTYSLSDACDCSNYTYEKDYTYEYIDGPNPDCPNWMTFEDGTGFCACADTTHNSVSEKVVVEEETYYVFCEGHNTELVLNECVR